MKKPNKIPQFKNEDEEREFWSTHSPLDFMDQLKEVEIDLSELKPSTETISLRLPQHLLYDIKTIANSKDVPYQSLMKVYLAEMVKEEKKEYGIEKKRQTK
ncbi:MAG: BrnA antitoxin family protein [bacterium]|nr:BrnA antitoxin family protein [bacterium]